MLEVPQVQYLAPVEQTLAADHLDDFLGQCQSRNRGFVLFQQGARFQCFEGLGGEQFLQDRAIENSAAADAVGTVPHQVVFEQADKEILEQGSEMGYQIIAGRDQFGDRGRVSLDLLPRPAVVPVAFQPQSLTWDGWNVSWRRFALSVARCHRTSA